MTQSYKIYNVLESWGPTHTLQDTYTYNDGALFLTNDQSDNLISIISELINKPKDVKITGDIYTGKLSNIPRDKFKEFIIKNKLKRTSKIDTASVFIINKIFLSNLQSYLTSSYYARENLFYLEHNQYNLNYIKNNLVNHRRENLNDFFNKELNYVIIDRGGLNNFTIPNSSIISGKLLPLDKPKNTQNLIDLLHKTQSNPEVKIIFDDDLFNEINSDGIELDDEYIETLDNMFASKDSANIKLAFEMLKNVNISKHLLLISLLLNKHHELFIHGSGIRLSDMPAYKPLNTYFKNQKINWQSNWKNFNIGLFKKFANEPDKIKIITDNIKKEFNRELSNAGNLGNETIQITNIELILSKQ
jgi:hypothetical protein